jgi:hypothetical protein
MDQVNKRDSRLYGKVVDQLGKYRHFSNEVIDGKLHISGTLDIGFGEKNLFQIKILVDNRYPDKMPEVYETAGRVPSILDRHYMSDGTGCCLVVPHRYREYFTSLMTFEEFIDVLVVPYFQNQLYYEINGQFVQGYKHGEFGIWEYYFEIFGEELNERTLFNLIDAVLNQRRDRRVRIKGHKKCPCESGLIQRHCHGKGLIQLKEYGHTGYLRQTQYYLYLKAQYKNIARGKKPQPPNYGLKVQVINPDNLPAIPQSGVATYNPVSSEPGTYILRNEASDLNSKAAD